MIQYAEPVLRLISFNLEIDGGPDDSGRLPERWHRAHRELLAPRRPDAVFRQEANYSRQRGRRRLHAAQAALGGMAGFLGPTGQDGVDGNRTALFLRPDTFPTAREYEQTKSWRTPPTIAVAQLADVPDVGIVMASWHGAYNSPPGRELEAMELTALADKMKTGTSFIGAGDTNEYPVSHGETVAPVDWTSPEITDRVHVQHRTTTGPDGGRASCTAVDQILLGCGLQDPARHAATHLGQRGALDATAGHTARGQGGRSRLDRFYLDPRFLPAVLEVAVLDTTGISDHHAVELVLARRKTAELLRAIPARAG